MGNNSILFEAEFAGKAVEENWHGNIGVFGWIGPSCREEEWTKRGKAKALAWLKALEQDRPTIAGVFGLTKAAAT